LHRYLHAFVSSLIIAVIAACGAGGPTTPESPSASLKVVATTSIVADLVRAIGGEQVEVLQLMGPGVDPHLYKPTAGDVRRMASASAIFYSGLHLEGKMTDVLEEMARRGTTTVAVASSIPVEHLLHAEGVSGLHDPHVWFDVALWRIAAEGVRDALVQLDAVHSGSYSARAEAYREELQTLDAWVRERVATIPPEQRVLVTAHDAFAYFGSAYGLEVRGLLGVSTAAEAGTAEVQRLSELIANRRIAAVFVETSVPQRYIEALREAVRSRGVDVALGGSLYSDALGEPDGPAGTYIGTVRSNVDTIVSALGGAPADGEPSP
jgi:manganese/zinc/iron transport system substrate-binding protein